MQDEKHSSTQKPFEISDKALLYKYHDAFYKIFHQPLDWIPPDNRTFTVCGKAHCNALCSRIMESEEGAQHCRNWNEYGVNKARATGKPVITCCHAGYYDVTIPIIVDKMYLGSLCFGQFLRKKPNEQQIRQTEKRLAFLKLRPGEIARYYKGTRVLTKAESEGIIEMLQMLGTYICETYGRWQFLESLHQSDPITQATQYMQHHYAMSMTVDGLARSVGMSKSHFIHRFTEQTGYSPIAYLNHYRITQSVEMLRTSKMSIAQIADKCGFMSITHFNRLFLRFVGKTPKEIRNEKLEMRN